MLKRVLIIFPVPLFVLVRQFYANLLGVDRDFLTALLVLGLALVALLAFQARMRETRSDLLVFDLLNLAQLLLAGAATYFYFIGGRIEANQAIFAVYYNCVAPFLIYSGFLVRRLKPVTQRAALVGFGCAYAVTVCVAVCESLGIDFRLFEYDRWNLQRNYFGFARASGLYGTQIDYGLLSFLAFTVAFYCNTRRRHWFTITILVLATIGTLLSMSRIWIAGIIFIAVLHMWLAQSLRGKLRTASIMLIMAAALYVPADQLGIVGMLKAADPTTQESNEGHWWFFQNAPAWLDRYMLVGIGPGTQNGPDEHETKIVSDFLWLATVMEFGTLLGTLLVLFRMTTIALILKRTWTSKVDGVLRPIGMAVCVTFLFGSFIDSAYAHPVSVAAAYVICGLFLYDTPEHSAHVENTFARELQPI